MSYTPTAPTPMGAVIMQDNPAIYWPLDEPSGWVTASDLSGFKRGGQAIEGGTHAFGATKILAADPSAWSNTSGCISRASDAGMDVGTGDFTYVLCTVCTNATGGIVEVLGRDPSSTGNGQLLRLNSSGFLQVNTGGTASVLGTSRVSDSNPHHIVYRRLSGVHSVWVDGTKQGEAAATGSTNTANRSLHLGLAGHSQPVYTGRMAHFAYYTTGLSDARIAAHYAEFDV